MRNYIHGGCMTLMMLAALRTTNTSAQEVRWNPDIDSAWRTAQATNRPFLIFVTSSHCHYCDKMKSTTLANRAVAQRINGSYVPVVVSAEESPEVTSRLHVRSFPTIIVISPDGRIVERLEGYFPAGKLQARLDAVVEQLGKP